MIRDLSERLAAEGLALENLGDIDVQTVAGAISTATHGTGERFGNISSQVEALELVTADGSVVECSRESDPELWRAARVGLGSLGAIATVTFRVVPAFTIRRHDHPLPLEEAFARLDELAARQRPLRVLRLPAHAHRAVPRERARRRAAGAARPRAGVPARDRAREPRARAPVPGRQAVPVARSRAINRLITRTLGGSVKTDASHKVFSTAAAGAVHRDGVRDPARSTARRRCAACST